MGSWGSLLLAILGWTLGDRGWWGQVKAVPGLSILSGSQAQQLSLAAHPQLLLSFSCHKQLGVVKTQSHHPQKASLGKNSSARLF